MAWGFLNLENHVLDYVNCGHLPPILLRHNEADQVEVQLLEPTGPVIGILEGAVFSHRTIQMQPGDILLLFSDGLTEVEDAEEVRDLLLRISAKLCSNGEEVRNIMPTARPLPAGMSGGRCADRS